MNKSRRPIIAGNWKMHGSRTTVSGLLEVMSQGVDRNNKAEVIVFPPFVFLEQTERSLVKSVIKWGGQNMSTELAGAFTGEVSGTMLIEFGCRYVLVGHSERRIFYGEDDAIIARKFALAKEIGLQPILCLGETLEQRKNGLTQQVVCQQLSNVLGKVGLDIFMDAIIAYEPVWAIGTGLTATPVEAQKIHAILREQVAVCDRTLAEHLRILYGGSIKAANARELFAMPDIDGGLVGGASLDANEFLQICRSVN